ncbi:MAG: hypothetical protein RIQ60_2646 [Pseudomonadota bacterium]|jgi:hypothetical protein
MAVVTATLLFVIALLVSRVRRVCHFQVVRSLPAWGGLMRCDLRRRTLLTRTADTFPMPREERLRVWSVGGVPVHVSGLSVGLPASLDARIDTVDAMEFDASFRAEFRLADPAR